MEFAVQFKNYGLTAGFTSPLRNVNFEVRPGESLGLIGPAGSGKTMLLHVISQMIWESAFEPEKITQSGSCHILGFEVTPNRPTSTALEMLQTKTAIVCENSAWLPLSIAENFELSQVIAGKEVVPYLDILESVPLSNRQRAQMSALAELLPNQVEQPLLQHLAILRALLKKPALLLLDEPFVRMDPVLLKQTENLILNLAEKAAIVWATNDLYQASRVTDMTLFILHGQVMECTPTPKFFTHPATREAENFIAGRDEDI